METQRNAKLCTGCGKTKERKEFYESKTANDGMSSYCRACGSSLSQRAVVRGKNKRRILGGDRVKVFSRYGQVIYTPGGWAIEFVKPKAIAMIAEFNASDIERIG